MIVRTKPGKMVKAKEANGVVVAVALTAFIALAAMFFCLYEAGSF